MKQFCLTTAMGKRLIGKAMVVHPEIQQVLQKGTLVIIAGSTNGYVAEEILTDSLCGANHALHEESGIFCIWRHNPGSFNSSCGNPIPIYRIPGGYMLQFNPEYQFAPQEMAVE